MHVEIITPEHQLFTGEASYVFLPGSAGGLGILNNHAPLISSLKKGEVRVKDAQGKEQSFSINGGTAEVLNNKVIVLAE
ncbi:MAG: ATP synthase F1 subunit epsilon [Bacteroidota bacterium]|jgi:F-type H+-transporting ATPase subunit epsilon|nr:ATP synthase F1 subunit epsilon [Bacteroidota bacterium]